MTLDSVRERLFGWEENRLEKIEKNRKYLMSHAEELESSECFFQPQIYKSEDQVMRTTKELIQDME